MQPQTQGVIFNKQFQHYEKRKKAVKCAQEGCETVFMKRSPNHRYCKEHTHR
jgi:hypothetical protein